MLLIDIPIVVEVRADDDSLRADIVRAFVVAEIRKHFAEFRRRPFVAIGDGDRRPVYVHNVNEIPGEDGLLPEDQTRLRNIAAVLERELGPAVAALIGEYYDDPDRMARTPRHAMGLHVRLLIDIARHNIPPAG